jgi:hypothetical protein
MKHEHSSRRIAARELNEMMKLYRMCADLHRSRRTTLSFDLNSA